MNDKNNSFEHALSELEAVVQAMEAGDVPLEKLIAHFEKGSQLVTQCRAQLANLEQKIEQLSIDSSLEKEASFNDNEDTPISPRKQPKKIAKVEPQKEGNPFLF